MTFSPQVRYLWKPTDWWGRYESYATKSEAEAFLAWLRATRGDEIAETKIVERPANDHYTHVWIADQKVPRSQAWRYKLKNLGQSH